MIHRLSYWTQLARARAAMAALARARVAVAALARPCIAIAAAYALALQVLLLSVTAASTVMAPYQGDAFVICYGGGDNADNGGPRQRHSPAGFADCTLSCAQGLSSAILPSDISPVLVSATGHPLAHGLMAAFVLSQQFSPRLAQGPPQTV